MEHYTNSIFLRRLKQSIPKKQKPIGIAWAKAREFKKNPIPSTNQMIEMAKQFTDLRARALFIVSYLTASRLDELVRPTPKQILVGCKDEGRLKKSDITPETIEGRPFMVFRIYNEKNRDKKFKELPISTDREKNRELLRMFFEYVDEYPHNVLFDFSYQYAYELLKDLPFNPHTIRKIRLTNLARENHLGELELLNFAGWTDTRPAPLYVRYNYADLARKL